MDKQRILIPIDGSDFSRRILPQIGRFFMPNLAQIHLLHVADHPAGHVGAPTVPAASEYMDVPYFQSSQDAVFNQHPIYASQERDSLFALLQDDLRRDARGLEHDGYEVIEAVRFGDAGQEIVAYAAEAKIDLIAMTTHGRTGIGRLLFGSVAEHVAHKSPLPVMLLRPFGH